jgi:hypothetical protein
MSKADAIFTDETMLALLTAREELQDNHQLYHDVVLFLRRLQRTQDGPLTTLLAALVQGS